MKIELCVGSLEAARLASQLPIDRIETCVALEQGGLTPTASMVQWIRDTFDLEQHVLIRQRAGGFCYSYDEIVVMRNQIVEMRTLGVTGVVIGALNSEMQLDIPTLETWKRAAGDLDLTFHRAFDDVTDWKQAIDQLVKLGFKRILTSGQASTVLEGQTRLQEMIAYAAGRIEVMAGGGINEQTIDLCLGLGLDAIHFSGSIAEVKDSNSIFSAQLLVPNYTKSQAILDRIQRSK
jgi:copper homeostasis protein